MHFEQKSIRKATLSLLRLILLPPLFLFVKHRQLCVCTRLIYAAKMLIVVFNCRALFTSRAIMQLVIRYDF